MIHPGELELGEGAGRRGSKAQAYLAQLRALVQALEEGRYEVALALLDTPFPWTGKPWRLEIQRSLTATRKALASRVARRNYDVARGWTDDTPMAERMGLSSDDLPWEG